MPLYRLNSQAPTLDQRETIWIAPTATVIGAVTLRANTSVWFGAVLRGDNEPIEVGRGSNIQENVVMHTDPGFPLTIGEGSTIGHKAMLHGCQIGPNSLIGMGATILNGATIGPNSLVGAHSLVPENKTFPEGVLILGTPAKVVRELSENEIKKIKQSAQTYQSKIPLYQEGLQPIYDESLPPKSGHQV